AEDVSVVRTQSTLPPSRGTRWAAAKSQAAHDGPSTRKTERLGPDHEDLGAGRGRVPGLADGAAPVAGRPRGGGGRQLRPQALRRRSRGRVPGADRAAADPDRGMAGADRVPRWDCTRGP